MIEDSAAANVKKSVLVSALESIIDHGNIVGLADDDHTQYYLADGTREISGDLNHDGSNIGFFAVTPVARPGATDDIKNALVSLGLLQGASATPLDLDGGALTVGAAEIDGDLNHDGANVGFYAKAPVAQPAASANLTDSSGGAANDTVQALTDPGDAPVDADALRDDLVANLIPELRNNYADLTAKVNDLLTALRNLGLIAT